MFRKSLTILFHGVTTLWPRKCCYGMEQLVLYFIFSLECLVRITENKEIKLK